MVHRPATVLVSLAAAALLATGAPPAQRAPRCSGVGIQLTFCLTSGGGQPETTGLPITVGYSPAFSNYASGISPDLQVLSAGGLSNFPPLVRSPSPGLQHFISGPVPAVGAPHAGAISNGRPLFRHAPFQPAGGSGGLLLPAAAPHGYPYSPAHPPAPFQNGVVQQPLPSQTGLWQTVPSTSVGQHAPAYGRRFSYAFGAHRYATAPQRSLVPAPPFPTVSRHVSVLTPSRPIVPQSGPAVQTAYPGSPGSTVRTAYVGFPGPAVKTAYAAAHPHYGLTPASFAGSPRYFQRTPYQKTAYHQTSYQAHHYLNQPSAGAGYATGLGGQPDIRAYYQSAAMVGKGVVSTSSTNTVNLICDFTVNGPFPSSDLLTDVVWQKLDSPGYLNAPMRSGKVFSNHLSCPNAYLIPPPANYGFSIHGTRTTLTIQDSSARDYGTYRCYATRVSRLNPSDRSPVYMDIYLPPHTVQSSSLLG